jgi:hypothetical protein
LRDHDVSLSILDEKKKLRTWDTWSKDGEIMCRPRGLDTTPSRVIESLDGILDSFCTKGQGTIRQLGRARHAFELRYSFRLLATKQTQRGDTNNGRGKFANRSTEKTRAIRPAARILLLRTLRRSAASGAGDTLATTDSSSELSMSSSREHVFSTATSISATYSEDSRKLTMFQQESLKGAHSSRQQTADSR